MEEQGLRLGLFISKKFINCYEGELSISKTGPKEAVLNYPF